MSDPYMQANRLQAPRPVPREPGAGFGAGLLVLMVFVVVAIMAAAIFTNRDLFGLAETAPAAVVQTRPAAAADPAATQPTGEVASPVPTGDNGDAPTPPVAP